MKKFKPSARKRGKYLRIMELFEKEKALQSNLTTLRCAPEEEDNLTRKAVIMEYEYALNQVRRAIYYML